MDSLLLRVAGTVARWLPADARRYVYRLGPLTGLIRRTLNRAAPTGVHPVRIAAGPLAGAQLLLDLQVDKDLWLGTYEPQVQRAVLRLVRPGMTAYDLGANIGYFTVLMARRLGPAGKVVALEPLPDNVDRLRETLRLNRLESNVVVIAKAVGAGSGRQRFLVHRSPGMGRLASLPGRGAGFEGDLEVEVTSVDELVYVQGLPAPDVVKLDLEGGEGLALQGMRRVMAAAGPILVTEIHNEAVGRAVLKELAAAGYSVYDLDRGEQPVRAPADLPAKVHLLARRS